VGLRAGLDLAERQSFTPLENADFLSSSLYINHDDNLAISVATIKASKLKSISITGLGGL
jgi:hypothetical protein